jgi:hypothetical protein
MLALTRKGLSTRVQVSGSSCMLRKTRCPMTAGDEADRYVAVPIKLLDALTERAITPAAFSLAVVMLSHVNRKRGDWVIWPSRQILASKMRLRKADNIDKYVRELEKADLIKVERRQEARTKTKNRYDLTALAVRVREIPPKQGPSIPPDQGVSIPPGEGPSIPPGEGVELEEVNQLNKPRESAAGASSSSSRSRREDDDEARAQTKIKERKDRQHRAAVRDIVRRLDTDEECAEAAIAYVRDVVLESTGEVIGAIDRYVAGIPDDELAEHHESATWEIRIKRSRIADAERFVARVAELRPDTDRQVLHDLGGAYLEGRRRGYDDAAIVEAVDQVHKGTRGTKAPRTYVDAISALIQQMAA